MAVERWRLILILLVALAVPAVGIAQGSPEPPFNSRSARLYLFLDFHDGSQSPADRSRIVIHAELAPGTSGGRQRSITDSTLHIFGLTLQPTRRAWDNGLVYDTVLYVPASEFDRPLQLDPPDVTGLSAPAMPGWRAPAKLDDDVMHTSGNMLRLRLRSTDATDRGDPALEYAGWGASVVANDTLYVQGHGDPPASLAVPLAMLPRRGPQILVNFIWSRQRWERPQPDNSYTIIPRLTAALGWTINVEAGQ